MSSGDGDQQMIGALLRIPFQVTVSRVHAALLARGFKDLRPAQMTKQSMGYLVDALEAGGYVARVPDPADHRTHLVVLTERSRDVERVGRAELATLESEWNDVLGRRLPELRELLVKLVAATEGYAIHSETGTKPATSPGHWREDGCALRSPA